MEKGEHNSLCGLLKIFEGSPQEGEATLSRLAASEVTKSYFK